MRERIKANCDKMLENYILLEKAYPFETSLTRCFMSLVYDAQQLPLDIQHIKGIEKLIQKNTGIFSVYRGSFRLMLATLLAIRPEDPELAIQKILANHQLMKQAGFYESTYFPIANYALYATTGLNADPLTVKNTAEAGFKIYQKMKANHPWLTTGDDYPFAILLTTQSGDLDLIEQYYTELARRGFTKGNGLQLLSHILSFSKDSCIDTIDRCDRIAQEMKAAKMTICPTYYATLGMISLVKDGQGTLIPSWIEASHYLSGLKKYKWLGKGTNVMLASTVIVNDMMQDFINQVPTQRIVHTSISITMETLIAAQNATMIAAITATTAAANAATY